MPHTADKRSFITLLVMILLAVGLPVALYAEENTAADQEQTEPRRVDLIEAYKWSNLLPKELIDLQLGITSLSDINDIKNQLPELTIKVEDLEWDAVTLKSNPNLTFYSITAFDGKINKLTITLNKINKTLQKNISELETRHAHWLNLEQQLQEISSVLESEYDSSSTLPDFSRLPEIINTGKDLINAKLQSNLLVGHDIGKLQTRIYSLSVIGSELVGEMNASGTEQTSPSMLSADFYKLIDSAQMVMGWENLILFGKYQFQYLAQNLKFVTASLLFILFLSLLIKFSQKLVKSSSGWTVFAERPLVSSIFVFCVALISFVTLSNYTDLPPDWNTLLYLPLLFCVAVLANTIFKTRWKTRLVRHLIFYISLTILLTLINLPRLLFYLFVFYASIGLLAYLIWVLRRGYKNSADRPLLTSLILGIFPALIIIAGISGYDQLAVVLFGRLLSLIAATITIRIMLLFISALLELILINTPWRFVKTNAASIVQQIHPVLALLHFILWIAFVLVITWVYPTLFDAFEALFSLNFTFGSLTITTVSVITIVLIVYITMLVSRALRGFLLQEILPRHKVEKGVQLSITRLVHYAIFIVGFLVLLRVLGFGLNQITILGGALGVGIGFGLQAIVNNFVSGLILLFERPIKVGDMIDVGTQVGEVKELGLRATTVQTFDNAEVVIPNSQLISSNVINWTLAEKKVRVRIPVGVAYGTDISKVFEILLNCAQANPSVLSTPKPVALFLAFGSSSLDFELRVWIADFNDKFTVLSELNQDIESEFQLAGVEIPFPQTDLHLRSVDRQAAESLYVTQRPSKEGQPPGSPAD
jgi:potassium-dependent mechanosensitive channel